MFGHMEIATQLSAELYVDSASLAYSCQNPWPTLSYAAPLSE